MGYRARHSSPRAARRRTLISAAGIASVLAAAAGFAVLQPFPPGSALADGRQSSTSSSTSQLAPASAAPTPGAAAPTRGSGGPRAHTTAPTSPTPSGSAAGATLAQACRPTGLVISALGVDARVTEIGLERDGSLGVPSERDRRKAGWYPSVLAGSPRGTVLMDGHTYRDGSAIFTTDSTQRAHLGMAMRLSCANGAVVTYRLTQMHLDLTPETYPDFVSSRRLYAADGPAQLVMITCTGWSPLRQEWDNRAVLIATPVAAASG
ncbi:class F sortase [Humibacillus xanthopallidus]|uniref:Sortase family protein n=1 Tax=Humibacillus xanthopallidus TaxID=412689 RepID=A0A543HWU6_9MICO|nr:class F sortase [Humibacillus xanthopallidus]TQM62843.1 sortase family protein [Humibacillus xanthopallidus]